jgi:hypothetical protein
MEAYCAAAGADRAPLARRAVAFAGARLVQTGLEHASAAGHAEAAAPLLRLALVLLERSGEAAAALRLDGAAT